MVKIDISPTAFSLFGLIDIKWYAILYVIAFEASIQLASYQIKNKYSNIISKKKFVDFMYTLLPIIIIGARIGHIVFFDLKYYISNPIKILNIRDGGLSFHGGLIAIAVYILIHSKRYKISLFFLSDILCYCGSIALAIGRCGNFINQELYGIPTNSAFGVVFSLVDDIARHPVQLYEAFTEGLLNFLVLYTIHKKQNNKFGSLTITIVFLIIYSVSRLSIDFLKYSETNNSVLPGQILSVVIIIAALVLLIIKNQFKPIINA